jgi:hypothetical protein
LCARRNAKRSRDSKRVNLPAPITCRMQAGSVARSHVGCEAGARPESQAPGGAVRAAHLGQTAQRRAEPPRRPQPSLGLSQPVTLYFGACVPMSANLGLELYTWRDIVSQHGGTVSARKLGNPLQLAAAHLGGAVVTFGSSAYRRFLGGHSWWRGEATAGRSARLRLSPEDLLPVVAGGPGRTMEGQRARAVEDRARTPPYGGQE